MIGNLISLRHLFILGLLCLLTRSALGQTPVSVTILPNTVTAGASSTGIVALSAPATNLVYISLTSNTSGVTVPARVTVAAGKQSAMFTLSTQASDKTAIVTLTASRGGNSAVGFFMVQAATAATSPVPAFAGLTFSPTMASPGQQVTGTIAFTQPLVDPLIFTLTSQNANVTVPSQVTVPARSKSFPFKVTVGANATIGVAQITATLAPGLYINSWTGPMSTVGSLAIQAGLPPHYTAGLWVGTPQQTYQTYYYIPTLKTYPDGRFCIGGSEFYETNIGFGYGFDYGPYGKNFGRISSNGQINLESNLPNLGSSDIDFTLFPYGGGGMSGNSGPIYGVVYNPSYLYDNSTLTFSSDGKTATLTVVAQAYTWTLTATPTIVFGNQVTLGTYIFTRVQ